MDIQQRFYLNYRMITNSINSLRDCIVFGSLMWWLRLSYRLSAFTACSHFIYDFRREILNQMIRWKSANPVLLTPLIVALRHGDEAAVNLLLHHGVPTDLIDRSSSNSCLHTAIEGFRLYKDEATCIRLCKTLLDLGSPIDHCNSLEKTPLMLALECGIARVADLLITRGANVHLKDSNGLSALHYAIIKSFPVDGIPKRLLDAGVNPNDIDNRGSSMLKYAVGKQSYDTVMLLLDYGADCKTSSLALMLAVRTYGFNGILELLLASGANVNLEYRGKLPLEYIYYNLNFVEPLIIVVAHIALLVSRDRYVSRKNLKLINDTGMKRLYRKYLRELRAMKSTMICEGSSVTYFDLLTKTNIDMTRCLHNEKVRFAVTSVPGFFENDKSFPSFMPTLQLNIETGLHRYRVIEELRELLHDILGHKLPVDIINYLCQYFGNQDLKDIFGDISYEEYCRTKGEYSIKKNQ